MTDQQPVPQGPEVKPAGAEAIEKAKKVVAKMSMVEKLSAGGGILYLIGTYVLDYAKVKVTGTSTYGIAPDYSNSGATLADKGSFWFTLGLVAAIIAIALPFLDMFMKNVKLPFPKSMLYFVAGVVAAVAPIAEWIFTEDKSTTYYGITVKLVPELGMYLMIAAGAAIAYGGFQSGGMKQLMAFFGKAKTTPPAPPAPPAAPQA